MVRVPAAGETPSERCAGEGERPLEVGSREVLCAVTLDHAQHAGMGGQHVGIGQDAVHDQPLFVRQLTGHSLPHPALHRLAQAIHLNVRRRQRPPRLPRFQVGEIDHQRTLGPQGPEDIGLQSADRRDGDLAGLFGDGAQAAVLPPAPGRGRDVGTHDRRHAVVPHHGPALDAVEKSGCRWDQGRRGEGMSRHGASLDEVGPGDFRHIAAPPRGIGHEGSRHRARRDDGVDPAPAHRTAGAAFTATTSPSRIGMMVPITRGSLAASRLNARTPSVSGVWFAGSTTAPL